MPTSAEVVKTIEAEIARVARIHEADELCHKSGSNGWLYQHGKAESLRGILWWLRQNRDALTADSPEPNSLDRYTLAAAEFYGVHPSDVTPHLRQRMKEAAFMRTYSRTPADIRRAINQ